MKKMNQKQIAKLVAKFNKSGYKSSSQGWWTDYCPLAVIGETPKTYRCVVVDEKRVNEVVVEPVGPIFDVTYKADPTHIKGDRVLTIRKADFHENGTWIQRYDWGR